MKSSSKKSTKLSITAKLSLLASVVLLAAIGITIYSAQSQQEVRSRANGKSHKPVCLGPVSVGHTRCNAIVVVDQNGQPIVQTSPAGYGPAQFLGAYNLPKTVSTPTTIAIVDAFDHPNILSDLNTYSSAFGVPTMNSCPVSGGTPASPCFQKVDQRGGTAYPVTDSNWALEIALDVEVAHAICQNCNILLVEADNNYSYDTVMAAIDTARLMGARVISNSYGGGEFSGETSFDFHFNYTGIAFLFASGDNGYGTFLYPAASQYVTAVGGTTLYLNPDNSINSEIAWGGSGSGCSLYEGQPSWQTALRLLGCSNRIIADVSADADANTAAAVYNTVDYYGKTGWFQVGGRSVSTPIISAIYALKGVPAGSRANSLPYLNSPSTNLRDITFGANGFCAKGKKSYLCNAVPGYDGPTGLGAPKGTGAF